MQQITEIEKLDNPVWYALSESHRAFAISNNNVQFYQPNYCPFGAFTQQENMTEALAKYANLTNNFFMVGQKPIYPNSLTLQQELVCLQMIIEHPISITISTEIRLLTETDMPALFNLVNLVQPGYFRKDTAALGNYYGIFQNKELVAVTGERMQLNAFIEVSAVVTHPHHTRKGYAKQLITHTANNIFAQGKLAFLHVAATNTGAIALYESLGFTSRRKISFWHLAGA
ncbi:GNAT family N-acetyltransferase [Limnovirga soli]|uniref:GNAT family N-acetyltransferase n=1 Tax=Limnovirga soli TaxID=2656915 RepID=A0A8J8FFY9_9BACT|nr:GNAT family N-acetyltransferase [Limnovirga soli]NNV55942.1 GNAT family N-acetyltransferase [Limnovirga soli]